MADGSVNIDNAFKSFQDTLVAKETDLQKRIEAFEKRVELFEKSNPQSGSAQDVLYLNVGGELKTAVRRSTLTQYPDSVLAATFSGRWDDSLEKDPQGRYFIDQDPQNFRILLSFLREKANLRDAMEQNPGHTSAASIASLSIHNNKPTINNPSRSLCAMLQYYELLPFCFPVEWITVAHDQVGRIEQTTERAKYITNSDAGLMTLPSHTAAGLHLSHLTLTVPRLSQLCIGWVSDNSTTNEPVAVVGNVSHSCAVWVRERQFRWEGELEQEFAIDENSDLPLQIEMIRDRIRKEGTLRIIDRGEMGTSVVSHTFGLDTMAYPAISFSNSSIPITVSDFVYAFPPS